MRKILTISIAAYNVEKFIKNTLDSLLIEDIDDLEILVEDDGGTDDTAKIVKEYEKKCPNIVKLVHKENGGYGSTINKSIELAKGKYFKQLDGDDWYDSKELKKFIHILRSNDVDIVYSPYKEIYEDSGETIKIDFLTNVEEGEYDLEYVLENITHHLLMYQQTFKTELLRQYNIKLAEKCFYTDTEYALYPIIYAKNIYVTHNHLYCYRRGLEEQSVSIVGRTKHFNDHCIVSKRLVNFYNDNLKNMNEIVRKYYLNHLALTSAASITNFLMVLPCSVANKQKIIDFEHEIKNKSFEIYEEMANKRKIIKILRKTNYKAYYPLSFIQKLRFK